MKIKATHLIGISSLLYFAASAAVEASIVHFTAQMDASQVVPASTSTATGTGIFTFDTETMNFTWNVTVSGLSSTETAAHIHSPAAPGEIAGPLIDIGVGSPKTGSQIIGSREAANLFNGLWYVQNHTENFSLGEIRGQIVQVVPLPGAAALLVSGLAGLGVLGRWRVSSAS